QRRFVSLDLGIAERCHVAAVWQVRLALDRDIAVGTARCGPSLGIRGLEEAVSRMLLGRRGGVGGGGVGRRLVGGLTTAGRAEQRSEHQDRSTHLWFPP